MVLLDGRVRELLELLGDWRYDVVAELASLVTTSVTLSDDRDPARHSEGAVALTRFPCV